MVISHPTGEVLLMQYYGAKNILTLDIDTPQIISVTRTYGCCGVSEETDRDGVTTTYAYDEFKRVSHTVRDGIPKVISLTVFVIIQRKKLIPNLILYMIFPVCMFVGIGQKRRYLRVV